MTYLSLIGLPPLDWVRTPNLATGYCTVFDSLSYCFCVCVFFFFFVLIYYYCTVFDSVIVLFSSLGRCCHVHGPYEAAAMQLRMCSCSGAACSARVLPANIPLQACQVSARSLTLVRTRMQANPPALPPISVRPSSGPTQRVQLPTSRKTCANGAANGAAPAQPATQVPAANGAAVAAAANGMCPAAAMTPIKLPCSGDELFEVTVQVITPYTTDQQSWMCRTASSAHCRHFVQDQDSLVECAATSATVAEHF